jgi:DNA-binding response OmpR family regulator
MKRILIIEDDPKIVTGLEIRFRARGYATLVAGDAPSGLTKALQTRPDLILLDVSLPGGDGLRVAQKLRSLPDTRSIPIIFVTASNDQQLRAKAMDLNAAGLFDKPYDADELLAVVDHALGETGFYRRPPASSPADANTDASRPSSHSLKRVLIIEDDQKVALALALRLKSAGYDTNVAYDALTGVSSAVRFLPDLVLLDISIPAGTGFTVAERLRHLMPSPTPVIFLTASKQPDFRKRATQLGAAGYFEKPYESADLLAAIQHQIGA